VAVYEIHEVESIGSVFSSSLYGEIKPLVVSFGVGVVLHEAVIVMGAF
jgi:hypothetical protein